MRRLTPAVLLVLLLSTSLGFAGTLSGKVFIDASGDGVWQEGEEPVAGALVSDGISIAASAQDGTYSLVTPDGDQVVFVVNPAGTWASQGFHRNVTIGPATADFPLIKQEQRVPLYFVQGTDSHIRPDVADKMARYVAAVNSLPLPIAFVVHTGDLVVDTCAQDIEGSRRLFKAYHDMVADLEPDLFNLPGNHEQVAVHRKDIPPTTKGWGKGLYRECVGPMYYAFNYGSVHFIAMDGSTIGDGKVIGRVPDECFDWLSGYLTHLDPSEPLVLFVHQPFATMGARKTEIEKLLAGRKVLLALSGHGHGIARWSFAGGTEIMGGATSYAWHGSGFPPNAMGYHVIKVTREGFESAFADWAEPYSLTLRTPTRQEPLSGTVPVQAMLFDPAGEVTSVDVSIGDSRTKVTQFGTEGLYRTLEAGVDVTGTVDGVHDLCFTIRGKGEPFIERQPVVVINGKQEEFSPSGPAVLKMRGYGIAAANRILINGEELAQMKPDTPDRQPFEFEVPADRLRRLNFIEVESARDPGGVWDSFVLDIVELAYDDQAHIDPRMYRYASRSVTPKNGQPGKRLLYIDLTQPVD